MEEQVKPGSGLKAGLPIPKQTRDGCHQALDEILDRLANKDLDGIFNVQVTTLRMTGGDYNNRHEWVPYVETMRDIKVEMIQLKDGTTEPQERWEEDTVWTQPDGVNSVEHKTRDIWKPRPGPADKRVTLRATIEKAYAAITELVELEGDTSIVEEVNDTVHGMWAGYHKRDK